MKLHGAIFFLRRFPFENPLLLSLIHLPIGEMETEVFVFRVETRRQFRFEILFPISRKKIKQRLLHEIVCAVRNLSAPW